MTCKFQIGGPSVCTIAPQMHLVVVSILTICLCGCGRRETEPTTQNVREGAQESADSGATPLTQLSTFDNADSTAVMILVSGTESLPQTDAATIEGTELEYTDSVTTLTIDASQSLTTSGAVKLERDGNRIRVTIIRHPDFPGKTPWNDGCWVKVKNGEVIGCHNDGNCAKNCLLRTYNGAYYCVCGNQ